MVNNSILTMPKEHQLFIPCFIPCQSRRIPLHSGEYFMDVYGKIDPNRIHKMENSHSFYQNTYIPWDTLSTYSRFYFTMLLTCTIVSRDYKKCYLCLYFKPFFTLQSISIWLVRQCSVVGWCRYPAPSVWPLIRHVPWECEVPWACNIFVVRLRCVSRKSVTFQNCVAWNGYISCEYLATSALLLACSAISDNSL